MENCDYLFSVELSMLCVHCIPCIPCIPCGMVIGRMVLLGANHIVFFDLVIDLLAQSIKYIDEYNSTKHRYRAETQLVDSGSLERNDASNLHSHRRRCHPEVFRALQTTRRLLFKYQ